MRCHTHGGIENNCKGQSAIEYLTTYGWMLLVVAIVGGSIFTTVQNSADIQSVSGLANADVQVDDYGLGENGVQMELRAAASDQVDIEKVTISDPEEDISIVKNPSEVVPVGGTETLSLANSQPADTSDTYNLQITYDTGGLDGLTAEGQITGSFALQPPSWSIDADGDGSMEQAVYSGQGTSSNPYRVDTLVDLQAINKNSTTRDSSYSLTSDVDASPTESWNSGAGFDPIDSFSGSLNGNGYSIENLSIRRSTEDNVGMFSSIAPSGEIERIRLENISIYGDSFVGGLAGSSQGDVEYVAGEGNVYGLQKTDGLAVGGLFGDQAGSLTSSYSNVDVYEDGSGSYNDPRVGGFQGQGKGTVKNSYSTGLVDTGDYYSGGFTGRDIGGTYENVYWDIESSDKSGSRGSASSLSTSEMTGDSAADNMDGFDFQNVWRTVDGDYPELR